MHPNLAEHLHTEECNAIIRQYKQCLEDNPYMKVTGKCNDLYRKMSACLTKERNAKMDKNAADAKRRYREFKEKRRLKEAESAS